MIINDISTIEYICCPKLLNKFMFNYKFRSTFIFVRIFTIFKDFIDVLEVKTRTVETFTKIHMLT